MASPFENFRYRHPLPHSNATRPADRKAATTFRGIVARCHASRIRITSALCRSYVIRLKRLLKNSVKTPNVPRSRGWTWSELCDGIRNTKTAFLSRSGAISCVAWQVQPSRMRTARPAHPTAIRRRQHCASRLIGLINDHSSAETSLKN
jgi:hypothetical protein